MKTTRLVLAVLAITVTGQDLFAVQRCANQDLNGVYVARFEGRIFPPVLDAHFARITRVAFDGRGGLEATHTRASYNGLIDPTTFTGSYSVAENCTVTISVSLFPPPGPHFTSVISDNKQELAILMVLPYTTIRGVLRRQSKSNCSLQDLSKGYQLTMGGTIGGVPFARVGRLEADGTGGFTATSIVNLGGVVTPEAISGTYEVTPDCVATFKYPAGTPTYWWWGVLHDQSLGASLMVANPPGSPFTNPPGAVIVGTLKQQ